MASASEERGDESDPPGEIDTGAHLKTAFRSVQKSSGESENSYTLNLTEIGSAVLGVSHREQQALVVFQNGIWVPRDE